MEKDIKLTDKKSESLSGEKEAVINLLMENLKKNDDILIAIKEIKKYIRWQKAWSIIRFLIIAIPIVLSLIYLPPIIQDSIQSYQSFQSILR